MNKIIWKFVNNNITIRQINKLEELIGFKFPKEYIECILNNNGGYPDKNTYDIESEKGKVFEYLLSVSNEDDENVLDIYKFVSNIVSKNIVPFGADPFGNYICFDFGDEESIVLLNHEQGTKQFVSKSFIEFIEKLY